MGWLKGWVGSLPRAGNDQNLLLHKAITLVMRLPMLRKIITVLQAVPKTPRTPDSRQAQAVLTRNEINPHR